MVGVLHALGKQSMRIALLNLRKLWRKMPKGGKVWVILIGPTIRSFARLASLSRARGWETISSVKLEGFHTQIPAIKYLINLIPTKTISAILFSGHASGWMIGGWRRPQPLMSLEQFNRYVLDRFKPRFVAWNTCLMGSMASLYGLPSYVKVSIASPGLFPSKTVLYASQAFADSTAHKHQSIESWMVLANAMADEWHHGAKHDPVRCLLVFDVERVKKLAPIIRRLWPQLVFDKRAQIHNTPGDGQLFDLWTAARHFPQLQRKILECVKNSEQALVKTDCCFPCRRSRAMSVEARAPKKFMEIHANAKWTQFLGNVIHHPPSRPSHRSALPRHTRFPTIPRNIPPLTKR